MPGIGETVAHAVRTFFEQPENRRILERLLEAGVEPVPPERPAGGGAFAGRSVVFTGTMSMARAEAEELVRHQGGRVSGSVSKATNFLVAGEEAGSKLEKARKLGVPVLTEQQFLDMVHGRA